MKRSQSSDYTNFNSNWELDYFFILNGDNKPECLVCNNTVSTMKKFNIKRHYLLCHKFMEEFKDTERIAILNNLKESRPISNTNQDNNKDNNNNGIMDHKRLIKASYIVSAHIAKANRSFSDGEFIHTVTCDMLDCFGAKGKELKDLFRAIPLSRNTITRRVEDIDKYLTYKLANKIKDCRYFSLTLNENVDNNEMVVWVKTIDDSFSTKEELLKCIPMLSSTNGTDIYKCVKDEVEQFGGFTKLSSICTDGGPTLLCSENGFVGNLISNNIVVPTFHCIIHLENLCAQSISLNETMETVKEIINQIGGELELLSKDNCLEWFFARRNQIQQLLESHVQGSQEELLIKMKSSTFTSSLAFLTDIYKQLNILNLKLQNEDVNIFELRGHVNRFKNKLEILKTSIVYNDFQHFECLNEILNELDVLNVTPFIENLSCMQISFEEIFHDLKLIKNASDLFYNPLHCQINEQASDIHMELYKMQDDTILLRSNNTGINFWKTNVDIKKYPKIVNTVLKHLSMFASTYICKKTFSSMKLIKTTTRNKLSDNHLNNLLRISVWQDDINYDELIQYHSIKREKLQ